jgi:hypothetical membrane protein
MMLLYIYNIYNIYYDIIYNIYIILWVILIMMTSVDQERVVKQEAALSPKLLIYSVLL